MFHHFESEKHLSRPGSISDRDFDRLLGHLQNDFTVLNPDDFLEKLLGETLRETDIVLTFDDSLLSQFDVAAPVMDSHGLKAVFNVYSSVFTGNPDPLELFAIFRASEFESFDDFWEPFLSAAEALNPGIGTSLETSFPAEWLSNFPFYSTNERKFRFLRDKLFTRTEYSSVMFDLINRTASFDPKSAIDAVWMKEEQLQRLIADGHSIGLHSHTHPTQMADLAASEQQSEYAQNMNWIKLELGVSPRWVAHPCGNYSKTTLDILQQMGLEGGFRSSLTPGFFGSPLEIPREDHSNLMQRLLHP